MYRIFDGFYPRDASWTDTQRHTTPGNTHAIASVARVKKR